MIISLIAAVDENGGIGKNNQLLCHLPADLQHFKKLTLGKPVVMGRKTFESIGKPLPQRINLVMSRQNTSGQGVVWAHSLEHALSLVSNAPEIMIIGGSALFEMTLPQAHRLYLTTIHHQFQADTFFPMFDKTQWICRTSVFRPRDELNPFDLTFSYYEKK